MPRAGSMSAKDQVSTFLNWDFLSWTFAITGAASLDADILDMFSRPQRRMHSTDSLPGNRTYQMHGCTAA
ncbi:hypothetical protein GB937_007190 [Aspergillus fischeri]|nr:hypothetical protein GB937_007190 [Aspergillus fischeri]